ncbi:MULTISPECIES: nucleotidyltransferase family protein [unclassified Lentilitoribacter]|uniref:nucleotidyltransferase family protein n=1 Tax=unclassified Lentilitoribacter TaxID=2647570 RepID=UPI0013A6FA4D|nr:nucleotidyltransferase family protein [Lentilitoribacter sp. Alg239-R112]
MSNRTEITAIILAAGSSSRMGEDDKLMMMIDNKPLLHRTVKNVCASDISKCIVVVRSGIEKYRALLVGFDVEIICATEAYKGMSASMKAGVNAAGEDAGGYLICLADMPDLTPNHINEILSTHQTGKIVRPKTDDGRYGHPVLFDQCYYSELKNMSGDEGARALIKSEQENVIELEMDDAILIDLDTPEAWASWTGGAKLKC